ncbi:MAG: CopD family protein [Acetobacteraceae bacterium]
MSPSAVLVLLRGAHVAALLSVFGTLAFMRLMPPADLAPARRLRRLAAWSAAAALALGAAWLAAEAGAVAGVDGVGRAVAAIPEMLVYFQFGRLLLARLVLLAVVCALLLVWRGSRACLVLSAGAVGLQPLLAHAGAISGGRGDVLVACEIVHLLAAGAWAGGLLPLLLSMRASPAGESARLLRRFSRLGVASVAAIVASGVTQLGILTRGFTGLIGSAYGAALAVKLALIAAALVLALLNRSVLTARLLGGRPDEARRAVDASVAAEAALALGIVLAAGWLASLAPGG